MNPDEILTVAASDAFELSSPMPVYVDPRAGSCDLVVPLQRAGLAVETLTMPYGDVVFAGHDDVSVGVEYKKLPDLVQSIRDGRLAGHQLPGLTAAYEYTWLLVEGEWRPSKTGILQDEKRGQWRDMPGRMSVSELEKHLLTFELCGGVHVAHTHRPADSVRWLTNLYRWFTDRSLSEHTSHLAPHQPSGFVKYSPSRQAFRAWPGVGDKLSGELERHFQGSLRRALDASHEELADVGNESGRRLGDVLASKLQRFFDNGA
jgi:ERCC4-type nuclease